MPLLTSVVEPILNTCSAQVGITVLEQDSKDSCFWPTGERGQDGADARAPWCRATTLLAWHAVVPPLPPTARIHTKRPRLGQNPPRPYTTTQPSMATDLQSTGLSSPSHTKLELLV